MTNTPKIQQLTKSLTVEIRGQLDRLSLSHKGAISLLADFREVATAVFTANNIAGTFTDWNLDDPICQKIETLMPPKLEGMRFAHLAVACPVPGHFGRFVFYADTNDATGRGPHTSLQCLRLCGAGRSVDAITNENFDGSMKRLLIQCANISRGNGLPASV